MEIPPGQVLWNLFLLRCCIGGGKKCVLVPMCWGSLEIWGVHKSYHRGQENTFWLGLAHPPPLLPHSLFSPPPVRPSNFRWAASINTELS